MRNLNYYWKRAILFIYITASVFSSRAQILSFTQVMDSLMAPLDKSRITTGILYERVKPWANIDLFNLASSNPPPSEYNFFMQAYFEMYNACYNNSNWIRPKWLRGWAEGEALSGRYTIGILDYQFNMIDSNALNNGQLSYYNGQFHDMPGAPSPYWTRKLQMAAILADKLPGGSVTLHYNSRFVRTNMQVSVSSITLNFGTIGTFILSPANPTATINFTGSGIREFIITVQYTNGSSFSHSSEIQIGESTGNYNGRVNQGAAELPDQTFWISSKYPYQGYEETYPAYGKAKISIWWKKNSQNQSVPGIVKPIIILDGIDAFGDRADTTVYKLFTYDSVSNGQTFTLDFARELRL